MAVDWNDGAILQRAHQATMRGVVAWIGKVETKAVDLIMSPPKSGRVYRRRGVDHQSSAAGQAPANWTGRLVNSRRIDLFEQQLMARLTFSTEYARPLQLGTENMEPRPWLDRALEETKHEGKAAVEAELRAEFT